MTQARRPTDDPPAAFDRAGWMTLLAESPLAEIEALWATLPRPAFTWIRRPEHGSAMIRARASGTGAQFNLGDVTVVRCTLQLDGGEIGIGYVMGRDKRHAALAALFDAMLQREAGSGPVTACLPALAALRAARLGRIAADTRSSKVDFSMSSVTA